MILALAALLRPVSSHALALSLAISIDGALRRSFNPADVLFSCPSDWGRGVLLRFSLHSRLASLGCCSGGALLALLRPVVPFTLALLRSALRRLLGLPALLLALLTRPMISLLSGRRSWGSRHRVTSISRLASLGCYSDGAFLALLRPLVPYTLALSVALSAGGVSRSSALQHRFSWPTACPPSSFSIR